MVRFAMRGSNRLSTIMVAQASKPGRYADGGGLYLQVSKTGTRAWLFRFMRDGVARHMGLGSVCDVSLSEARTIAGKCRKALLSGADPIEQRRASRLKAEFDSAHATPFMQLAKKHEVRRHNRLAKVIANRVDPAVQAKILGDIRARIPIVTLDEQRIVLGIFDPDSQAGVQHLRFLKKLAADRGHFTEEEADLACGYCTIEQAREAGFNLDPEIGEKFALWLIGELKKLREGERQVGSAPVLRGKTMSRLDIADLAVTMLENCEDRPRRTLICLIQQLLDIDRHRKALIDDRQNEKLDLAVNIDVESSLVGRAASAYQLARHLSVSPTTMTAWRRLPEYHAKRRAVLGLWKDELREYLDKVKAADPNLAEQQASRRAFEMYKQDSAKRSDPEFYFWAKESLETVFTAKALKLMWNYWITPHLSVLTPAHRRSILELHRKTKIRLFAK